MGYSDRINQTLGNISHWAKQTANTVSNGLNWAHQNILSPGIAVAKAIGGDVGRFAADVETGANAVNELNQKYRSNTVGAHDLVNTGLAVNQAIHRGRESAGGAKAQVRSAMNEAKEAYTSGSVRKRFDVAKKVAKTAHKVSGAIKRSRV